jgi:hypothetical protein
MSFRITARDYKVGKDFEGKGEIYHQVYGNHEFPAEIRAYLLENGCKLDTDDCFYDYEINDLQGFFEAMLEAHNGYMEDDSYWDFKPLPRQNVSTPWGLVMHCMSKKENSYAFIVYNFYEAFSDFIAWGFDKETSKDYFKYKDDNKKIYLSGF